MAYSRSSGRPAGALVLLFLILLNLSLPAPAGAQAPTVPDESTVRVRFGPLWLNPSLSLPNIGVDTNVFNEAESDVPESDFTITMTPQTDAWLRMGRTWLSGGVREDFVWYKEFASERSVNGRYSLGWIAPLNRLTFGIGSSLTRARERQGFEIDARVGRTEPAYMGSVELRATSRTHLGVRVDRRRIDFREDAIFLGASLSTELNRTITSVAGTLRHELTPLTSVVASGGKDEERFEFSPHRDADSTRLNIGLNFDPQALIRGSATFGYRKFEPVSADVPGFTGATLNASLTYVARGSTKITFEALRDLQHSFELMQPYYVQTGVQVGLAQQIYGPADAELRLGRQRLAYQDRIGPLSSSIARTDRITRVGGGVGYRISPDFRVGFNVDRQDRHSPVANRNYDGMMYGVAITYGL
jgi:hypothetical protein